jgi:hypothetical protein
MTCSLPICVTEPSTVHIGEDTVSSVSPNLGFNSPAASTASAIRTRRNARIAGALYLGSSVALFFFSGWIVAGVCYLVRIFHNS